MLQKGKGKDIALRLLKALIIPVAVYLLFTILSGGVFGRPNVMLTILKNVCKGAFLAWAMMIIMTTGMLDMSMGANAILGAIIGGNFANSMKFGLVGWMICMIVCCVAISMITACVVIFTRLPSMVVTLGLILVYEALTISLSNSKGVNTTHLVLAAAPWCYIVFGAAAVLLIILLRFTKMGTEFCAIGNGTLIAKAMGANIIRIKFKAFFISGIFVGIASVMMLSNMSKFNPQENLASLAEVFTALMAVVIGQFLSKYCDQILATLIGTFVMKMMASGLLSLGLSATLQNVCIGVFLLVFMAISTNQDRVATYFSNRKKAKAINAAITGAALK